MLHDLVLILAAALIGGAVARVLRLPLVVGYILAGIVIGPHTWGPTVIEIEKIEVLADVGVALLLFTLGMEFSLNRLSPIRPIALIGTPIQIAFVWIFGFFLGRYLGWPAAQSFWLGALVSLSSTSVVLKVLMERNVLGTLSSRIMVGMLLVQDLAVIPMMAVLPVLSTPDVGAAGLVLSAVQSAVLVGTVVFFGARILPRLLEQVVCWNSRELFLISLVATGLGVGYIVHLFGLSIALGAFLAGMVLSESPYSHQALAEVSPLRDVFLMVFFVSIGMLLDVQFLADHWRELLLLTVPVMVFKGITFSVIARGFGYGNIAPLALGLTMFQIGEFSFVLGRFGVQTGFLAPDLFSLMMAAAVVSMALTPLISVVAKPIYDRWRKWFPIRLRERPDFREDDLREHVVIAGFGRVGRLLGHLLHQSGQEFIIIDLDYEKVLQAQKFGYRAVFGDIAAEPVLEVAGVKRANLVILTVTDPVTTRVSARTIRRLAPGVRIVARVTDEEQIGDLARLGVGETVQPEMEAALELGRQALLAAGYTDFEIGPFLNRIRLHHYLPLTGEYCELDSFMQMLTRGYGVEWIRLSDESPLVSKSIEASGVRTRT